MPLRLPSMFTNTSAQRDHDRICAPYLTEVDGMLERAKAVRAISSGRTRCHFAIICRYENPRRCLG